MEAILTIPLAPVSKKNSMQIIRVGGHPRIIPSKNYRQYEKEAVGILEAIWQTFPWMNDPITDPVNVEMVFYMPTHRRVDLVNLQEAALDVMVKAGILADDNSNIVTSMDGSAVMYDKENPRTVIMITRRFL